MKKNSWIPTAEVIVLLAVLVGAGYIWRSADPYYLQLSPHPFWVVIILIGLRYGSPAGYITGGVCAALFLAGHVITQGNAVRLWQMFHVDMALALEPFLFVVVGFVIAEAMETAHQKTSYWQRQEQELRDRLAVSEKSRAEVEQAYQKIESQIASQTDTVVSLYESAKQLESLQADEIFSGLVGLLQQHIEVEACEVWEADDAGDWSRVVPGAGVDVTLPMLAVEAKKLGRVVSAEEFQVALQGHPEGGLLAGPLYGEKGQLAALVVVTAMPFRGFTHRRTRLFELLLDWTSHSLANAERLSGAAKGNVFDAALALRSAMYLVTRADESISLARRQGDSACLMICRTLGTIKPEVYERLLIALSRAWKNLTRLSDTLAYVEEEKAFVVFLPEIPLAGAEVVRDKFSNGIAALELQPYEDDTYLRLAIGISPLLAAGGYAPMLQAAKDDAREVSA